MTNKIRDYIEFELKRDLKELGQFLLDFFTMYAVTDLKKVYTNHKLDKELKEDFTNKTGVYSYLKK